MTSPTLSAADTPRDFASPAERWAAEIQKAQDERKTWLEDCRGIRDRYRDSTRHVAEGDQQFGMRFNILWSNVQTLQPALFAATPNVVVERRWGDPDPVGRTACTILRRCVQYQLDDADFTHIVKQVVRDHLLYGQGTLWVRYEPHFDKRPLDWPVAGGALQPIPPGMPQGMQPPQAGPGLAMGPPPGPPPAMPAVGSGLPTPPTPPQGPLAPTGGTPMAPPVAAPGAPMAPPLGGMPPRPPMPPAGPPGAPAGPGGAPQGPAPGLPLPPAAAAPQPPPQQVGALAPGEGLAGLVIGHLDDDHQGKPLDGGVQISDDGEDAPEFLAWEETRIDHVSIEDWLCSPCRTWQEARWVARRAYMTKDQLKDRFGAEIAREVPLDWAPAEMQAQTREQALAPENQLFRRAQVWEIWDRPSRKVVWLAPAWTERLLDEREDPLRLSGFFPTPRPLWGTVTTDSTVPVPDYWLYRDQAIGIDNLTARIDAITRAIKVCGVYDAAQRDVERMFAEGVENQLIPVNQWGVFAERGGLKGSVDLLDISMLSEVLQKLVEIRTQAKQDLYEVTGISDIIRGTSAASETATAQQIKSGFGTMRLRARQNNVARFCRDVINLVAELVCEHFQPRTMRLMSDIDNYASPQDAQLAPQALQLLRDDKTRPLRIDIETDSTTLSNQAQEQQSRIQFLAMAGQFLQQVVPAATQTPQLGPLLAKMLMFGIRAFPQGAELEAAFEQAAKQLEDAAAQPRETPPDPKLMVAQAQVADIKSKIQDRQADNVRADQENRAKMHRAVLDAGIAKHQADIDADQQQEQMYHDRHDAQRDHMVELAKLQQARDAGMHQAHLAAQQADREHALRLAQFMQQQAAQRRQENYDREDAERDHKVAVLKAKRPTGGSK